MKLAISPAPDLPFGVPSEPSYVPPPVGVGPAVLACAERDRREMVSAREWRLAEWLDEEGIHPRGFERDAEAFGSDLWEGVAVGDVIGVAPEMRAGMGIGATAYVLVTRVDRTPDDLGGELFRVGARRMIESPWGKRWARYESPIDGRSLRQMRKDLRSYARAFVGYPERLKPERDAGPVLFERRATA